MPYHILLPRLREDHTIFSIIDAGTWELRDAAELDRIGQSLDIAAPGTTSDDVDGIPNMWAHPLLFEMALYDTHHPMHERIVGEWRGLLAMLALKEWCGFPLTTHRIEIPDVNTMDDAAAHPSFLRALRRLLPKHTLDTDTTWENLDLILFDDQPIGFTSPTTLVCTSANYIGDIWGVPWFLHGRHLCDPVPKLNEPEKAAVASWLMHLHTEHIQYLVPPDDAPNNIFNNWIRYIINSLNGLIREFRYDLGDVSEALEFSHAGLGLTQGLFRCLDRPIQPIVLDSNVEVIPSRDEPPETVLLVADEAIAEVWGVEPHDVFVWGSRTLETYQDFSRRSKLEPPENVHLRKPEDFFLDHLFVIEQENAFHEHGTLYPQGSKELNLFGSPVTPILPITVELLDYLNVNDLNDRITFEQRDTGIRVSLRLTLSGINEQNRDFTISKEYSLENVKSISTVPVLEIWPNFTTENWKAYYTYFNKASQNTFYAKPFLPADKREDAAELSQESAGDPENGITKTSYFPEAVLCQHKAPESSGSYEDAGILLIPAPDAPIADGSTWTVGIDFGTTSTAAYRNDGHADPCPIELAERLIKVTDSDYFNRLSLYDDFFSPESQQTPFFSLFHTWRNNRGIQQELEPLLDGHIYFLPDSQKFNDDSTTGRIFSDLKWSTEPHNRARVQLFLEQLCLQCAAEAVAAGAESIKWRFSIPLAFTARDESTVQEMWQRVTDNCAKATGLKNEGVIFEPESIAIAKYFARPKFPQTFAPGAICIDIGGETSDISIWQNNELYAQTSLRFAGRDIFLNLFTENPGFLEHFGVEKEVADRLALRSSNETRRYVQINALLNSQDKNWLTHFWSIQSTSSVNEFQQLIAIGIAGLLYYVGLLLKYLTENKQFTSDHICIYIAGKGSRILEWFGNDELDMRLLKQVFLDASGFNSNTSFRVEITRHPKEEIAFGLVSDKIEFRWKEDTHQNLILAGESFKIQGENFEWTEILTSDLLGKDLGPPDNLEHIQKFVESFNKHAGEGDIVVQIPIEMTESDYTDNRSLRGSLRDELRSIQTVDTHEQNIEPLFILALKNLLERKTAEWTRKSRVD